MTAPTPADRAVFDITARLMRPAAVLAVADRLEGAASSYDAALDEIALEAARLRAVVASEKAAIARLRRRHKGVSA